MGSTEHGIQNESYQRLSELLQSHMNFGWPEPYSTGLLVRMIVKLLIVFSVVINPIALIASGLPGHTVQAESSTPTESANYHPSHVTLKSAESGKLVSDECEAPCCQGGEPMSDNAPSCLLHHNPSFVAHDNTLEFQLVRPVETFGPNVNVVSHDSQPETPPPKHL